MKLYDVFRCDYIDNKFVSILLLECDYDLDDNIFYLSIIANEKQLELTCSINHIIDVLKCLGIYINNIDIKYNTSVLCSEKYKKCVKNICYDILNHNLEKILKLID